MRYFYYCDGAAARLVCTCVPHLSSRWNLKKTTESRCYALVSGAQNNGLSNSKLKFALKCIVWSQSTPASVRRTDERT